MQIKHTTVYSVPGRYAGWPANYGIWSWEDEIVTGFTLGVHNDKGGFHARDTGQPYTTMQSRSLDGGLTWGDHVLLDDAGGNCANNPTLVQVSSGLFAGRIIMMYLTIPDGCHLGCVGSGYSGDNIIRIMKMHSDDDGLTWSEPVDATPGCKRETTAAHPRSPIGPEDRSPEGLKEAYCTSPIS
mgnify:CR=1 FL=1